LWQKILSSSCKPLLIYAFGIKEFYKLFCLFFFWKRLISFFLLCKNRPTLWRITHFINVFCITEKMILGIFKKKRQYCHIVNKIKSSFIVVMILNLINIMVCVIFVLYYIILYLSWVRKQFLRCVWSRPERLKHNRNIIIENVKSLELPPFTVLCSSFNFRCFDLIASVISLIYWKTDCIANYI
jgi:hypothetical protein